MKLGVTLDILNQKATPAFYADTLANRPAAGFTGRVFISTDTYDLYRDTGTAWVLLSPANTGTITGGGSLYRVGIWTSTTNLGESNNLVFDYSTNRLGINTNAPTASLDVHGTTNVIAQLNQLTTGQNALLTFQDNSVGKWRLGNIYNAAANDFGIVDILNSLQRFTIKNTGQTFVGTETTSSGLLVVNSATADNQIVAIGANAPSIRINNGSAAKQVGIGISTATNNFIQGSADRDFCIFNGSTTAASPMLFGVYDAGAGNVQEAARFSAARNFILNSSTDAGFRFDVNGTARVQNFATITHSKTNSQGVLEVLNTTSSNPNSNSINVLSSNMPNASLFGIIYGGKALSTNNGFGINYNHISDGAAGNYVSYNFFGVSNIMRMYASGNTTIGGATTDAGFKLDVNGTARVQGQLTISSSNLNISTGGTNRVVLSGGTQGEFGYGTSGNGFNHNTGAYISWGALTQLSFGESSGTTQMAIRRDAANSRGTIFFGYNDALGTTVVPSSLIIMDSTTQGFLPPRMTTAQKTAIVTPVAGLVVYDTTLNKLSVFTGVNWETITSV